MKAKPCEGAVTIQVCISGLGIDQMMNMTTTGLQRYVEAQDRVYESVCNELALGEKTSHWMWFIFPQLKDLGRSPIAKHYGLASADEALDFWQHPVLGTRLKQCTQLVLAQPHMTVQDIFGTPDDLKFRSCMTLFAQVAPEEAVFTQALERFFGGKADESTLKLLSPI
jgi:uncharacterized protein (DUF1810 family)